MAARYRWVKIDEAPKRRKSKKAKSGRTSRQDPTIAGLRRFYRNTVRPVLVLAALLAIIVLIVRIP